MRKLLLPGICCAAVAAAMLWINTPPAAAVKEFRDQFEARYVKPDSTKATDVALAEAFDEAKCYVCHIKGKSRKYHNAYGEALKQLLDRKTDKDNVEKIQKALETVENQKSNPEKADSPTYLEIIKSGKLPAGIVEAE